MVIVFFGDCDKSNTYAASGKSHMKEEALREKCTNVRFPCCIESLISPHIRIMFRKPRKVNLQHVPQLSSVFTELTKWEYGQKSLYFSVVHEFSILDNFFKLSSVPESFSVADVTPLSFKLCQRLKIFFNNRNYTNQELKRDYPR